MPPHRSGFLQGARLGLAFAEKKIKGCLPLDKSRRQRMGVM